MPRGGRREKAGRKSGWVNSETQLIRVPKIFASRLIEIAKYLDQGHEVQFMAIEAPDNIDEAAHLDEPIEQLNIFQDVQNSFPIDSTDFPPEPMGLRALAERLGVSSGTLSALKKDDELKLIRWTYEKDGQWAWVYDSSTRKFKPVHPRDLKALEFSYSVNDVLARSLNGVTDEEDYEDF